MSTRMLIDARHAEETRVAIVKGSRVEDFDYESAAKRQIKGNIYLARITRVEPSLQACFVEYGGNRHGFLAFSEIHPDYYQIPAEDREELVKLEQEEEKAEAEAALNNGDKKAKPSPEDASEVITESVSQSVTTQDTDEDDHGEDVVEDLSQDNPEVEQEEEIEAAERRRNMRALTRRYKIQEVIKRRQVMLIQVVKEERGNKGAALTTYISLAGRYCVLMPNSTHSGGISRKISNIADRKRLKSMMTSLELPQGMGCIVRTAGMARTKTEVKRDLDYLLRLWNGIRDLTLKSVAPACIYEEGNLIKRSIRDLYSKDIEEILVEGNAGYTVAKNFITMLMPSHASKVVHYKEGAIPLFNRYQVESQLEAMYNPNVQLKSGGYIVINPTEALISVDVNSGRATKEKNIEETAVKTNLEAAEELGRQLRLRDMAGLIVIDFIDMEDRGNNRAVERRLKDVLKTDRARIQIGRISSFGLLEMSRQRLRPNLLEASMTVCSHCNGSGVVRSVESAALQSLRALEDEGIRGRSAHLKVSLNRDVAIYMLNKKRADIYSLEKRYALEIEVHGRRDLGPSDMEVERENIAPVNTNVTAEIMMSESIEMDPFEELEEDTLAATDAVQSEVRDSRPRTRRRRRRGRDRGDDAENGSDRSENHEQPAPSSDESTDFGEKVESVKISDEEDEKPKSRRRRGRRGGRRRKGTDKVETATDGENTKPQDTHETDRVSPAVEVADSADVKSDIVVADDTGEKPKRPRRRRSSKVTEVTTTDTEISSEVSIEAQPVADEPAKVDPAAGDEKPKRTRRPRRSKASEEDKSSKDQPASDVDVAKATKTEIEPSKPAKRPRRAKAVEPGDAAAPSETSEVDVPSKDAPVVSKPRRGRPKKAEAGKVEEPKAEPKAEKVKAEPVKAEVPKAKPVKAEPKTKVVKESPEGDKAEAAPDKPSRSGWWDKNFG